LADTTFLPGSFPDSGLFALDLDVLAGESRSIVVVNASHGDPFQLQAVPEPGTAALALVGLVVGGLAWSRRRLTSG
jgi:hypothetical protein